MPGKGHGRSRSNKGGATRGRSRAKQVGKAATVGGGGVVVTKVAVDSGAVEAPAGAANAVPGFLASISTTGWLLVVVVGLILLFVLAADDD